VNGSVNTPPERPNLLATLLGPGTARRRSSRTVFDTPDAHGEIANEEVTYRDPATGLVTEQRFTPVYWGCGHFGRNAQEVGGLCGICRTLVCRDCVLTCPACGATICRRCSRMNTDDGQQYCRRCLRAIGRRKRLATVGNALVGFFVERKE